MLTNVSVTLRSDQWEEHSMGHALLSHIEINGLSLHLEAWEMREKPDSEGEYEPVHPDLRGDYDSLYVGAIRDGAPRLLEMNGKLYFLFATPFNE